MCAKFYYKIIIRVIHTNTSVRGFSRSFMDVTSWPPTLLISKLLLRSLLRWGFLYELCHCFSPRSTQFSRYFKTITKNQKPYHLHSKKFFAVMDVLTDSSEILFKGSKRKNCFLFFFYLFLLYLFVVFVIIIVNIWKFLNSLWVKRLVGWLAGWLAQPVPAIGTLHLIFMLF